MARNVEKFILSLVYVSIIMLPLRAKAASFDCKSAKSTVEKTICKDQKLSALNDQLANAYIRSSVAAPDKEILKKEQREWVRQRRNKCNNLVCIESAYKDRIGTLLQKIPTVQAVADLEINGTWEEFKPSLGGPYRIIIKSGEVKLHSCKTKFIFLRKEKGDFIYGARKLNMCFPFSNDPLNFLRVSKDNDGDIGVRYFTGMNEDGLLAEIHFYKIEE